jgi:hypothetical protein
MDDNHFSTHRPITIRVKSVAPLPIVKTLPQDTMVPVNLKMDREMAEEFIKQIRIQLDAPGEIALVSLSLTGIS